MRGLGKLLALILLPVNALVAGLLLLSAYSPFVSPVAHSTLSCLGLAFPIFALLNGLFLLFWLICQRYRSALLPLVAFLLCGSQLRTYFPLHLFADEAPAESLKLLSYNVMSFADGQKQDGRNPILTYLQESGADIICLQEYRTWTSDKYVTQKDVERALKAYPYHHVTFAGTRAKNNRLACYSKYPILSARHLEGGGFSNGSVVYEIKWGADTLTLVNNHLESNKLNNEDKALYEDMLAMPEEEKVKSGTRHLVHKLAEAVALRAPQADAVAQAVTDSKHACVLVCGDFNDSPISYAHRAVTRSGLDDAFAETGVGPGISYHKNKIFFRIDHILASRSLKPYGCRVDARIKASDHYPISCRFVKRKPETK